MRPRGDSAPSGTRADVGGQEGAAGDRDPWGGFRAGLRAAGRALVVVLAFSIEVGPASDASPMPARGARADGLHGVRT